MKKIFEKYFYKEIMLLTNYLINRMLHYSNFYQWHTPILNDSNNIKYNGLVGEFQFNSFFQDFSNYFLVAELWLFYIILFFILSIIYMIITYKRVLIEFHLLKLNIVFK
jgi:hypothetical protein